MLLETLDVKKSFTGRKKFKKKGSLVECLGHNEIMK